MRLLSLFFSLLLSLTAFGQPSPINRRAFALAGLASSPAIVPVAPTNIAGLQYWWNFTDVATNSMITSWTDRISQAVWTNTASGPFNTPIGARFGSGAHMIAKSFTLDSATANACLMLFFSSYNNPVGSYRYFVDDSIHGSGVAYEPSGTLEWTTYNGAVLSVGLYPDLLFQDVFFNMYSNTVGTSYIYTNGITSVGFDGKYFPFAADTLVQGWDGYLTDVLWYTNTLSGANIAGAHAWWTNAYPTIADTNMVADLLWYKFEENSGTTIHDTSQIAAGNGVIRSSSQWVASSVTGSSYCITNNGTSDYFNSSSSIYYNCRQITVCLWVFLPGTPVGSQVVCESSALYSTPDNTFILYFNGSSLFATLHGTSGNFYANGYTIPTTGTWHHLAVIYDGSTTTGDVRVYYDHVLQTRTSNPNTSASFTGNFSAQPLYGAARNASSVFFNGKIDDFRIYGTALTSNQIYTVYSNPK